MVSLAAARDAAAEPGLVVIGGTAPEEAKGTVEVATLQATLTAGWSVPPDRLSKADIETVLRCVDSTDPWGCLPPSLADKGIQRVLVIQVSPRTEGGGSSMLSLAGKLISRNPDSVVVRQRYCEACTDDKLSGTAAELATQMVRELAVRAGKTKVEVRCDQPDASVILDGERVGEANGTFRTYPGKHVVVVEKPGHAPEKREVVASEGNTVEIVVTLRVVNGGSDTPGPARPSRLVPGLLLGAGVVALGAGIALQVTKDGPPLGEPQPSRIYSGPGIGLAVAGGVAVGVGVYLWTRASKEAPSSAPTAALVDGGAVIGWSGHY